MTNNKQQTAVEWQHIELMRINFEYATNKITPREFQEQTKYILEQAKEMHRKELELAYQDGKEIEHIQNTIEKNKHKNTNI
jgi:hypothetical protein